MSVPWYSPILFVAFVLYGWKQIHDLEKKVNCDRCKRYHETDHSPN
jgi:hypothetical protein